MRQFRHSENGEKPIALRAWQVSNVWTRKRWCSVRMHIYSARVACLLTHPTSWARVQVCSLESFCSHEAEALSLVFSPSLVWQTDQRFPAGFDIHWHSIKPSLFQLTRVGMFMSIAGSCCAGISPLALRVIIILHLLICRLIVRLFLTDSFRHF
jgi:hypothetical protein